MVLVTVHTIMYQRHITGSDSDSARGSATVEFGFLIIIEEVFFPFLLVFPRWPCSRGPTGCAGPRGADTKRESVNLAAWGSSPFLKAGRIFPREIQYVLASFLL